MKEYREPVDQNESPEDVATLYSWAKLLGANYREFSTLGLQNHDVAPVVHQDAPETGSGNTGILKEGIESHRESEPVKAPEEEVAAEPVPSLGSEPVPPAATEEEAPRRAWHSFSLENFAVAPVPVPDAVPGAESVDSQTGWRQEFVAENEVTPSWLSSIVSPETSLTDVSAAEEAPGTAKPHLAEGALQESRIRISSRWFALRNVFEGVEPRLESTQPVDKPRAPVMAIFSLAGGVGKSTIAASLSRALSACGERVLLVEAAPYGMLPFYFGARDPRPGVLRTFYAPNSGVDAPVQMMTVDLETLAAETAGQEVVNASGLAQEIRKNEQGASRVIVDLATASGAAVRHILRLSPTILVPVNPDMNSVVSVAAIDAFFHRHSEGSGGKVAPYFLLNQFDASVPLHLDIREALREQLGDSLLPIAVRRSSAVSEALAEGMTVMDYAPGSEAAEDFNALATWLKSLTTPVGAGFGGMRWNER